MTRGALPEARADDVNYPGTYVAGLYNRLVSEIAGRKVENEDLVNVPNWLPLRVPHRWRPWFDMQRGRGAGLTAWNWTCGVGRSSALHALAGRRRGATTAWCSGASCT